MDVHAGQFRMAILPEGARDFLDERTVARDEARVLKYLQRYEEEFELHCYYEAGCLGYVPHRWLTEAGIDCTVVPPAEVPRAPGDRVRTDPKDARRLAQQGRAGTLPAVYVPTHEWEGGRSVVRWRIVQSRQLLAARCRANGLLLSRGLRYEPGKTRWTKPHWQWLRQLEKESPQLEPLERQLLGEQLAAVEYHTDRLAEADRWVRELAARPLYAEAVGKLACFRGIDVLAAMVILTETIDFRRFGSAEQYMSFCGLTSSEESSGSKRRQGAITKAGQEALRWMMVEVAWSYRYRPAISQALRERQMCQPAAVIAHAWKAQRRLNRLYKKLAYRKGASTAVVAVARELSGFLWAVMVQ
jgi:transposase